jgi:zinc transporter, ZIP family
MEGVCNAFAAGALIAMVVETMIPEASHDSSPFNGLIAVFGFLAILILLGGAKPLSV